MLKASIGSGDWDKPLAALRDGIEKLRALESSEQDAAKKADLNLQIQELEARADKFVKVMQLQGRG